MGEEGHFPQTTGSKIWEAGERHSAKEPLGAEQHGQLKSGWLGRNHLGEGAREAQGRGKHQEDRRAEG